MLNVSDAARIVARSTTWYELLDSQQARAGIGRDGPVESPGTSAGTPQARRRLERWRFVVADGDDDAFGKRLAQEGLTEASALRLLDGPPDLAGDTPATDLPHWAWTLLELSAAVAGQPRAGELPLDDAFLDPAQPLPFEDVLAPIVRFAATRLRERGATASDLLAPTAWTQLERTLLSLLAFQCARTLHTAFAARRAVQTRGWSRLASVAGRPAAGDLLYREFVADVVRDGCRDVFTKSPVLARRVALVVERWIDATAEFVHRLDADRAEIARAFFGGSDPGRAIAVESELSDRHAGGRTVAVVGFERGAQVVYKPKPLTTDGFVSEVLAALARVDDRIDLRLPRTLIRDGYGWAEFVAPQPASSTDAARRYFHRVGQLLAILHVLRATDVHAENLVAAGEHPVLIDSETLFHPDIGVERAAAGSDALHVALRAMAASVMRTHLLPRWEDAGGFGALDTGGMGGAPDEPTGFVMPRWTGVNTDGMELTEAAGRTTGRPNVPHLDGRRVNPAEYADDIVAGFEQAYRSVATHRDTLLDPAVGWDRFDGEPCRWIARPTMTYALVLRRAVQPDACADGIEAFIEADALQRAAASPLDADLIRAEHEALAQWDVPRFLAPADTAASRRLIRDMNEDDLSRQVGLLTAALDASAAHTVAGHRTAPSRGRVQEPCHDQPRDARAAAERIGAMLQRRAHTGTDGSVTWIGIRYHSRLGRYRVDPLGTDLYGGAPGIGLFLAALARVTGAGELSTLAHGALSSLRGTLRGDPGSLPVAELGAADGVGSSVLSMLAMYLLTEDDSFLADACAAAALVTQERIDADDQLDVLGGSAGAIRALLALHRAGGGDDVLARAERCGRHLLRMRQVSASGYRAWPTLDGACIGGYSHGAAGISSALAALADRTGDADFAAAAEEGFRHQESLYDAGLGAWRSYVESVASEPEAPAEGVASWCHGAAGIALGYLSGGPPVDGGHLVGPAGEQRAVGLRRALTVLCDDVADRSDNLCCGTAGRAAVLLKASRTFGEQRWRTRAEELLSTMLERTTPHGLRVLQGARRGADAFGMFQGVAGIGYTLLQVCADDQLPDLDLLA